MKPRHILRSLREARKGRSLTLARMSALTGLNLSQISLIETGGVDPRLSSIEALAEALDLTVKLVPRDVLASVEAVLAQSSERMLPADDPMVQVVQLREAPGVGGAVASAPQASLGERMRYADPVSS